MTDDRTPDADSRPSPSVAPDAVANDGAHAPDAPDRPDASDGSDTTPEETTPRPVAARVASVLGGAVDKIESAAAAVGGAVEATARRFDERPGARVRRVRRQGHAPLTLLYDEHPDARKRTPRELGLRTIEVSDIAGTAVGGAQQRGGDFLPLKPFRSTNWQARWQRLRRAADMLAILPPIDVLRYGDRHWVVDGHNRVAQALYGGQYAIDADVTELVKPGQPLSEPPEPFASLVEDSRELRAAVSRAAASEELNRDPAGSADRANSPDPTRSPDAQRPEPVSKESR